MEQTIGTEAGRWLKRRDAWMRLLVGSLDVTRNGKLVGVYVALRMSAKRPFTYPAMKSMARDLNISTRQVARALKELEIEEFVKVRRTPGKTSSYSLNL